jgi:hypothetical protein
MGKASSSKKIARAARAGGRASGVRQRNLLFPAVIGTIVIAGSAMVVLAWDEHRDNASTVAPVANRDHWHAAYGFYVCGEWQAPIPENDNPNGIHTHGDGVIHIHPFSDAAAGKNARLGEFLDSAGVELSNDELKIGEDTWEEGKDECDGKDAELVVAKWEDVETTEKKPSLIPSDFGDTRFRSDGEGYTIAFVPEDDTDIPKPESAAELAALGASDADPSASTTVPEGETTTTVAGEGDTTTTAPTDTTAAESDAPTTTAAPEGEG